MLSMPDEIFRAVFVCTGNRCRSPYAARLLGRLTEGLPVSVDSVGTLDSPGQPSPAELIAVAARRRLDLSTHGAEPMLPNTLAGADLVIGFSFDHISSAVVTGGAPRNTTFLLLELTRLLGEVGELKGEVGDGDVVARARALVAAANAHRHGEQAISLEEVADPFGGPRRAYEAMAEEVDKKVSFLAQQLFSSQLPARPAEHGSN